MQNSKSNSNSELYKSLLNIINEIIKRAKEFEEKYQTQISDTHELHQRSAANLVHYLAFRSFDVGELQQELRNYGLPSLTNIEGHVMFSLVHMRQILESLIDQSNRTVLPKKIISKKKREYQNANYS